MTILTKIYKPIFRKTFWNLVQKYGYEPERKAYLLMENGNHEWGYVMDGFFDHHRQGLHHNQDDIKAVIVDISTVSFKEASLKSYNSNK